MLEFFILGPVEVRVNGRLVPVRGFRQRALLAMLLVNANEVVASDRLLDELWSAEAGTDTAVLRVRISQLRKVLRAAGGDEVLHTRPPGYVLEFDREWLDVGRHERLVAEAGLVLGHDPARAAARLAEALALWRGSPLADFSYEPFAQTTIGRLEELRLNTLEKWIDAEHPLREGLRGQMMLALYRVGRQAEALDVYQQTRHLLVGELGVEPTLALQELHRAVLAHDPSLDKPRVHTSTSITETAITPTPPTAARREWRKTVTILVCDFAAA